MNVMCKILGRAVRFGVCASRRDVRFNGDFRAAFVTEFGKPMKIPRLPVQPHLAEGQVRISVNYCSLNRNDVEIIDGECGDHYQVPFVPGYEVSGEVIEVASDSSCECNVGDRVLALSQKNLGGLAEQVIVDEKDVWKLPTELSLKDAAVVACGHATALLAFTKYNVIDEKSTILVSASAGGMGLAAVDIAASVFKSKVIAMTDSEGRGDTLRERGAFTTFSLSDKKIVQRILKETGNKGVTVAYDAIGEASLKIMRACLNTEQPSVILEARPNYVPPISSDSQQKSAEENTSKTADLETSSQIPITVVNLFEHRARDIQFYREIVSDTLQYCEDQVLTPHASKIFNLDDINEAIAFIKGKKCTGKVLIRIQD